MILNDLYIIKLTCRCIFLNKREVLSLFFGKPNIFKYFSTCQTRSNDFWIMNAMCTFVYLFVVYFSFAPVISASIHRYENYFDIKVLMMVTETETLTSTLHNNIFTYLDCFFLVPSYIYIYIYINLVICAHMRVCTHTYYIKLFSPNSCRWRSWIIIRYVVSCDTLMLSLDPDVIQMGDGRKTNLCLFFYTTLFR